MGRTKTSPEAIHSLGCCLNDHLELMNQYLQIISENLSQSNVFNVSIQNNCYDDGGNVCDPDNDSNCDCRWQLCVEYNNHTVTCTDMPCACDDSVANITYITDSDSSNYGYLIVTYSDGNTEDYYIGIITNLTYDNTTHILTVEYADGSTIDLHVVTNIEFDNDGNLVVTYGDGSTQTFNVGHLDSANVVFYNVNDAPPRNSNGGGTLTITDDQGNDVNVYFGQITSVSYSGGVLRVCRILDSNETLPSGYNPGDIYCQEIELDVVDGISCVDDNGTRKLRIHFTDGHTEYLDVCGDCGCGGGGDVCTETPQMDVDYDNNTNELTVTYNDCKGNSSTDSAVITAAASSPLIYVADSDSGIYTRNNNGHELTIDVDGFPNNGTTVYMFQDPDGNGEVRYVKRVAFDLLNNGSGVMNYGCPDRNKYIWLSNYEQQDAIIRLSSYYANGGNGKFGIVDYMFYMLPTNENGDVIGNFDGVDNNGSCDFADAKFLILRGSGPLMYAYEIATTEGIGYARCVTLVRVEDGGSGHIDIRFLSDAQYIIGEMVKGGFAICKGWIDYII